MRLLPLAFIALLAAFAAAAGSMMAPAAGLGIWLAAYAVGRSIKKKKAQVVGAIASAIPLMALLLLPLREGELEGFLVALGFLTGGILGLEEASTGEGGDR